MNRDREGLLLELATARFRLMLVLADEAEDQNEPWLAAGWRWLSEKQRWPAYLCSPVYLGWQRGFEVRHTWCWRACGGLFGHDLPGAVFNRLKGGKPRRLWRRWDSEQAALLAAAHAAGETARVHQEGKK